MSHWGLFTNSLGKMLHPVLWVYGLLIALASSGVAALLINSLLLANPATLTAQTLRTSLTPVLVLFVILSAIGFVFSTFGDAAVIYLVNKLEQRERITLSMGLDAGEKIFQLLVVRVILALPNIVAVIAALWLIFAPLLSRNQALPSNLLSSMFAGLCGAILLVTLINLAISAITVGAERAIVLEKMSIGGALAQGWMLLFTQLGDFLIIGLIFLGLSFALGLIFACAIQPVLALIVGSSLRSGGAAVSSFLALMLVGGLIVSALASILTTSVWTLAYRQWRAAHLPAPLVDEFA